VLHLQGPALFNDLVVGAVIIATSVTMVAKLAMTACCTDSIRERGRIELYRKIMMARAQSRLRRR